ncbi:MAG: glycerophosphodiester phosphodiesterase [Bacteroidales bacterium]|nr:glycerophosphodiester phosphodiesterase [Bacteroidales bacterium]
MKHFSIILALAAVLAVSGCAAPQKAAQSAQTSPHSVSRRFPPVDQKGNIAIVAHRGFWNCEAGGYSENSIASLKAAQDAGLWGSECDIHITADDVIIVNHDATIEGKKIATHDFADFAGALLPNGERRPTLDEYLAQAAGCKTTKLIIELKPQSAEAREDVLVSKAIDALKAFDLYNPQRVLFISFSRHICDVIAEKHPQFVNQFLSTNFTKNENPEIYANRGINGVDYHYKMFSIKPSYVEKAHELGMSVNAWTVDKDADIREMVKVGVDAITSNNPLLVREILGNKEFKNK